MVALALPIYISKTDQSSALVLLRGNGALGPVGPFKQMLLGAYKVLRDYFL